MPHNFHDTVHPLWSEFLEDPQLFIRAIIKAASPVFVGMSTSSVTAEQALSLLQAIRQLSDFLHAFRQRRWIGGKKGVATFLGISRHTVYIQIKKLDLEISDFFRDANVSKLIFKSSWCRPIAETLLLSSRSENVSHY